MDLDGSDTDLSQHLLERTTENHNKCEHSQCSDSSPNEHFQKTSLAFITSIVLQTVVIIRSVRWARHVASEGDMIKKKVKLSP
jgi:hypothetical protein